MATYVPNVGQYLPELKPFTPDYKFLSDVLQTKQTKYNTNYQQLNNAYSRILYSDLSRMDTNEARDQFVNKLQPTLEKISGLDLSLAQNVRAAEAVFDPFYENDLIMKDMVYTKNYNNNLRYAESLMFSTDKEKNERYWAEGIEFMKMKMDDFKNASQEQAMRMGLEQYVENPRLYKRAMEYLKGQGYTVEYDTISPDQNFIVKDVNGKNITKSALADLQLQFGKDPLINKAYYTQSYVSSRKFAKNQMEQGFVTSIDEGITKYNVGKLEAYKLSNAAKVAAYDAQIDKYNEQLAIVEKEMKGRTPKPGGPIDLAIAELKNNLLGTTSQREIVLTNVEKATELLSSGNQELINSMGYNIEMQTNMMADLEQAALNYSQLTAKRTIKVNQAHLQTRKEQHEARMAKVKFNYDLLLKEKETTEYEKRLKIKNALDPDGGKTQEEKTNDLLKKLLAPFLSEDPTSTRIGVTRDISEENIMDLNKRNVQRTFDEAYEIQKSAYINYKTIKDVNSKYNNMIKLPDGMAIKNVDMPFDTDANNNVYVNSDNFLKLLDDDNNKKAFEEEVQKQFKEIEEDKLSEIDPNSSTYRQQIRESNNKIKFGNKELEKLYEVAEHNLNNFIKLNDLNLPTAYQTKDGKAVELSLNEFKSQYLDEAIEKGYKIDLKRVGDTGVMLKEYPVIKEDKVQKVLEGKIPLYVDVDVNTIYHQKEKLIGGKYQLSNEKRKKILNPELFDVQKGSIPQNIFNKNKELMNKLGIGGYYRKSNNVMGTSVNFYKVFNKEVDDKDSGNTDLIKKLYQNQLEQLDKISKGDFSLPEGGAGISASLNNTGYKFYSTFTGSDDLLENIGDLQIGFKSVSALKQNHIKDPERYEESLINAASLLNAIKQPQSIVSKISATGRNEEGYKKAPLNSDQAFNLIQNTVASYLGGTLKEGENSYYTLEYLPANKLDKDSKYIITQTEKDNNKKDLYTNTIEVIVPKYIDRNPLLEENNPDGVYIDVMLDEVSNSMKDDYGYGGSLTITKNGSVYNINPVMTFYDPINDEVVEQSIINTNLIDFPTQYTDPTDVMKVREKYESTMLANEQLVRSQQKHYQEEFTKYQKKYKNGTWEDFINNYPYNK